MTRRTVREEIFKLLFQAEFHEVEEVQKDMDFFLDKEKISEKDKEYIQNKSKDILSKMTEIDDTLNEISKNWKTGRMAKVDLTILRLAVYEIEYEKISPAIVINEAVEIAKKYGTDKSSSFVNGVLAKIA